MQVLIDVQQLTKRYGEVEAVKGISFSVQKGALFAFLGSNGVVNPQQLKCYVRF